MKNWSLQLNVPKMARAVDLSTVAGLAESISVHGSHQIVVDSVGHWIPIFFFVGSILVYSTGLSD